MQFSKIHAMGNDFIVYGSPSQTQLPKSKDIRFLCDRHYGIGGDGLIYIAKSNDCDYSMHIFNPNGFEAEMCGNALRCSARYVVDCGYFKRKNLIVESRSGIRSIHLDGENINAEIGRPKIIDKGNIELAGRVFPFVSVSMGNPHCVIFVSKLSDEEFVFYGKLVENHPLFPEGTNVEFAASTGNNKLALRVWERGVGETLSCSTGSCAAVAAACETNMCIGTVQVFQPGGVITVETRECGNMFITGKCITVFKGNISLPK